MSGYSRRQKEFRKEIFKSWEKQLEKIFGNRIPTQIPTHYEWTDITQINDILNTIGINTIGIKNKNLNYMLYPGTGGSEVVGCNISYAQRDVLEIMTYGGIVPCICKPKQLIFDRIDGEPEWSYFRLELNELEPSGFDLSGDRFREEVYEYNGNFKAYSEYTPNDHYRHILRILSGTLLIIPYTCYYNRTPIASGGLHNKYNSKNFRNIMEKLKVSEGYSEYLKEML